MIAIHTLSIGLECGDNHNGSFEQAGAAVRCRPAPLYSWTRECDASSVQGSSRQGYGASITGAWAWAAWHAQSSPAGVPWGPRLAYARISTRTVTKCFTSSRACWHVSLILRLRPATAGRLLLTPMGVARPAFPSVKRTYAVLI